MGYFLQDSHSGQIPINLFIRIGTDPSCHVVIKDKKSSPFHAILGEFPDGLLIRDEHSAAGTIVNGERIEHVVALKPGDELIFGNTKFTIRAGEALPTLRAGGIQTVRSEVPGIATQQAAPATLAGSISTQAMPVKGRKKSNGCLKKGMILVLILMGSCVLFGGAIYLLIKSGAIPQRLVDVVTGSANAQINIYNFTDQIVYVKMIQKFDNENTITIPDIYWTLESYGSESDLSFSGSGKKDILTIGTTKDGSELGSCIFMADGRFTYNFIIMRDKVLVDGVQYPEFMDKPPVSANDLILSTSPFCKKLTE